MKMDFYKLFGHILKCEPNILNPVVNPVVNSDSFESLKKSQLFELILVFFRFIYVESYKVFKCTLYGIE